MYNQKWRLGKQLKKTFDAKIFETILKKQLKKLIIMWLRIYRFLKVLERMIRESQLLRPVLKPATLKGLKKLSTKIKNFSCFFFHGSFSKDLISSALKNWNFSLNESCSFRLR